MNKIILILLGFLLTLPTPVYSYMQIDNAVGVVQRIVDGKSSPWAIRDSRQKVKRHPILAKKHTKKMFINTTKVNSIEISGNTKSIDLRSYDSPIKDQGSRGWCTSFATIATIENSANQQAQNLDLSEIYLWNQYKDYDMYASTDAASKTFIVSEKDWPYYDNPVEGYEKNGIVKIKSYKDMNSIDEAIKSLDQNKPIIFGVETTPYWGSPNKGVVVAKGVVEGGHAIAIVGYFLDPLNETMGGGFLIFKNSWGTGWGDDGYGYLPFIYCKKYSCYFISNDSIEFNK